MEVICLFGSFEFWLSIKVFTDSIKQSEIKCYYPTLLLFIRFNAWANTWCIFPLTESHFKLDHVYFQQNLWIFFLHYSDHWSRPGSPPKEAFVAMGGSLVHCALSASVCLHLLTCVVFISSDLWSVMKFWIVWFFMVRFDQNLWLPDHKVAIKYSPNTVKLLQRYYQGRKYTLQSKDSYYL